MTMRSKQWYTKVSRSPKSRVNSSIGLYSTQGGGNQWGGKPSNVDWASGTLRARLSNSPTKSVTSSAAERDGRWVTVGSLALFSTDTGDAWLLDPEDHLAARLARDGDPEDVYFEETDTRFAIGWKGKYRIDGDAFVYIDNDSGRVATILGYPIRRIAE